MVLLLMDSPTDKNPPDSGLLPSIWMVLLLMDSPTDKNPPDSGRRINPADCGLRTLDLSLARRTGEYYYFHGGSKDIETFFLFSTCVE